MSFDSSIVIGQQLRELAILIGQQLSDLKLFILEYK